MRKIDSSTIVCTPEQAQQIISLGIVPASVFCYEWLVGDLPEEARWEFSGEYMGQPGCIPAWSLEELFVLIGPEFIKPDLMGPNEWTPTKNMMQWPMFTPKKRKDFPSGAQAAAEFLEYLLSSKIVTADECNARLDAWITKEHFNPRTDQLEKEVEEKRRGKV